MNGTLLVLAASVVLAFGVEATLGFGSTVILVTLGAFVVPIETLLPAIVPLNIVLSLAIVARAWRSVDVRMLSRRIAPAMIAGIPVGLVVFRVVPSVWLARSFAMFVLVLAALELWKEARDAADPANAPAARPLARAIAWALLLVAGVIHGAFATGGPMAVYVASRDLGNDKARFRATLSALWLVLNVVLVVSYAAMRRFGPESLGLSVRLALPLVVGLVAGECAHHRVSMHHFRRAVYTLLAAAGLVLLVRG